MSFEPTNTTLFDNHNLKWNLLIDRGVDIENSRNNKIFIPKYSSADNWNMFLDMVSLFMFFMLGLISNADINNSQS
jgi:hypothetical protein